MVKARAEGRSGKALENRRLGGYRIGSCAGELDAFSV